MAWNLARPRALVALIVVKSCKTRFAAVCGRRESRRNAWVASGRVAKIFRGLYEREAFEDDFPVDEETFAFGSFCLIPAQRMLLEDGKPLRLGSRALDILVTLVESAGETIHKDQLIARTWPDTVVDEGALRVHIAALRKALGDGRAGKRYIANIPGRGYSFAAPVVRDQRQPATAPSNGATVGGNLPASLTRIVGRDGIIAALTTQLAQRRFLTIVGPGGIGKTTVAVAVAETVHASYRDGVWFVGLASLTDPDLVPSALSAVLGISLSAVNPISGVTAWLRDKHALIVLDSCEHVIGAAASIAEAVLRAAPSVCILTTSREPLRAEGEWLHRLTSLEIPLEAGDMTVAEALRHSAVQLFDDRARAIVDGFVFDEADVPTVLEICRRLDGVPLALELAAARVDAFGVKGLAARLDDRFAVLTKGRRTALPRHQTLRAAMDWSYDLLPEIEQVVFRRLAVFRGGFTMEAAAAVAVDERIEAADVIEGIANLAEKSLVTTDISGDITYHRLLDTTRSYALEKLTDNGEAEDVARRHAAFFRNLVAQTSVGSPVQPTIEDMARYGREIDNVRAALDWSFSPTGDTATGVVLTAAFAPVWLHLALVLECRERAERALDSLGHDLNLSAPLQLRLYMSLAVALILTMGSVERTRIVVANALELAERLDDVDAQLRSLFAQWSIHFTTGECRAAQSTAEQFSLVARRTGDPAFVLVADRFMGNTLQYGGKQREAQNCFERMLELYVTPKNQRHMTLFQYDQRVLARAMLARALWLQGFVDKANDQARASLEEAQATNHGLTLCWVLHYAVCPVALMTGDLVAADRAVAMLIDLATSLDAAFWKIVGRCLEGKLLIERREFGRGSVLLRSALASCDQTEWRICYPEFMGVLAEGLAGLGQLAEGLVTVDEALASADRGGERYYVAELLRIKGELLLQQAGDRSISATETCFREALDLAREQGALFWELRAALSLARLRIMQDRQGDARRVLAPVYDRFTEGFDTADLQEAKSLLEQLA
jgi:predicted ATPase/DNA-binding winged helix-turn-helix (wHTH) protein